MGASQLLEGTCLGYPKVCAYGMDARVCHKMSHILRPSWTSSWAWPWRAYHNGQSQRIHGNSRQQFFTWSGTVLAIYV